MGGGVRLAAWLDDADDDEGLLESSPTAAGALDINPGHLPRFPPTA